MILIELARHYGCSLLRGLANVLDFIEFGDGPGCLWLADAIVLSVLDIRRKSAATLITAVLLGINFSCSL